MPTVADLDRLDAIVGTLRELTGKQRGELIEAEAWNRLVGAVIDIGRTTIEDGSDQVPGHKHTDQVSLDWLDPRLRAQILEGGANPANAAALAKLERRLAEFARKLDAVSERLTRIQSDVAGVATRDVEREAAVGTALRRLDGVFDAREDVAALRGSLRTIEGQVRTAADLSNRLIDDGGDEIDFTAISRRVAALEEIEARLTLPGGDRFAGDSYARDLARLRAELVTEEELRERLETLQGGLSENDRAGLLDAARDAAVAANRDTLAALETDLRRSQDDSLRQIEGTLDTRIGAATGDLRDRILSVARDEQAALLTARLDSFRTTQTAEMDRRLAAQADGLTAQMTAMNASVRDDVSAQVSARLEERIGGTDARIEALNRTITALDDQMTGITGTLAAQAERVETVNRELLAATSRLNVQLTERIGGIEATLNERIGVAAQDLRAAIRAERQGEMAVMRDQLGTQLTRTIRDVARTEVTMATSQLRGEMTDIATAAIRSDIDAIRAELRETSVVSDARLSGLVSAEVRRQTADLDARIDVALENRDIRIDRDVDPVIVGPVVRR